MQQQFSVVQAGVGQGADAWEAANKDPRHVVRVMWGLTKLDGIAGAIGAHHSFLVVTVRDPLLPEDDPANTRDNQYLVEKVADEVHNGLKVSRASELPDHDVYCKFHPHTGRFFEVIDIPVEARVAACCNGTYKPDGEVNGRTAFRRVDDHDRWVWWAPPPINRLKLRTL